ncbi:MAG: HAD family hydrolase [Deltaproteobacteria bacterium]|nr:HAD family hydrolase [Deltaproteobacteria bacterium]
MSSPGPAGAPGDGRALRPAVFLDRDGTINRDIGYLYRHEDFVWIDGAPGALARLQKAGLALVVVSNQSGVARGLYGQEDVRELHRRINLDLRQNHGAGIDAWYFCPHLPDAGCPCRKPSPGMLLSAAEDLGLDLSRSYMVGDKELDVGAGLAAGVRFPVLVRAAYGLEAQGRLPAGVPVADDLPGAAELILKDFLQDK